MLILPVFIPENGPADGILNPFALSLRNARQGSAKNIVRTGAAWPDILLSSPPMKTPGTDWIRLRASGFILPEFEVFGLITFDRRVVPDDPVLIRGAEQFRLILCALEV